MRLAYAAHSLNETLPGGPAFSTRLNYQQMRRFGATPAVASWAIALSGLLSTAALALITAGSAIAAGGATHWQHLVGLVLAAIGLLAAVAYLGRHSEIVGRPLAALNRLRHRPATAGLERITGFLEQLRAARLHPGHGVLAAAFALFNWLLDALGLWLCIRAVGEQPAAPATVLLAFCAAMAAGSLTIVPGGLGIVDSALILGLVAGGVPAPAAVATTVLYRVIGLGFIIGIGWLSYLGIRVRAHRREPAAPEAAPPRTRPRTSARLLGACRRQAGSATAASSALMMANQLSGIGALMAPQFLIADRIEREPVNAADRTPPEAVATPR